MMGIVSRTTYSVEAITLLVLLGEEWKTLVINVTFIVINALALYNAIL